MSVSQSQLLRGVQGLRPRSFKFSMDQTEGVLIFQKVIKLFVFNLYPIIMGNMYTQKKFGGKRSNIKVAAFHLKIMTF